MKNIPIVNCLRFIFITLLFVACSGGEEDPARPDKKPETEKEAHFPVTQEEKKSSMKMSEIIIDKAISVVNKRQFTFEDIPNIANDIAKEINNIENVASTELSPSRHIIYIKQKDKVLMNLLLDSFVEDKNKDSLDKLEEFLSHLPKYENTTSNLLAQQEEETPLFAPTQLGSFTRCDLSHFAPTSKKLLILAPFQAEFQKDYDAIIGFFKEAGYQTGKPYYDSEASYDKFHGQFLKSYDFIIMDTHGSNECRLWNDNKNLYTALATGTPYDERYVDYFDTNGTIIITKDEHGRFGMTNQLLGSERFDNKVIILDACTTATDLTSDGSMVKAFIEKGAEAVKGWKVSVNPGFCYAFTNGMVRFLNYGFCLTQIHDYMKLYKIEDGGEECDGANSVYVPKSKNESYFLYDPKPYNLTHSINNGVVTLSFNIPQHGDYVAITVVIEGKEYYLPACFDTRSRPVTYKFTPSKAGTYQWYVKTELHPYFFEKDDPHEPFISEISEFKIDEKAEPKMSVSNVSLNFNEQAVESATQKEVKIINSGNAPLTVSSISISGSSAFTVDKSSCTVPANGSQIIYVTFKPTEAGQFEGTLNINSNGTDHQVAHINLFGTGIGNSPQISVSTSQIDFGSILGGTTTEKTFTISNTGNSTMTVLIKNGGSKTFTVDWGGGTIPAKSTQTVKVMYKASIPAEDCPYSADYVQLEIKSDASNNPLIYVPCYGRGKLGTVKITNITKVDWQLAKVTYQLECCRSIPKIAVYFDTNPTDDDNRTFENHEIIKTNVSSGTYTTNVYYDIPEIDGNGTIYGKVRKLLDENTTYYVKIKCAGTGEGWRGDSYYYHTLFDSNMVSFKTGTAPFNAEVIDLGLSVKWAGWNVGASDPWSYGSKYAWGETSTKSSYSSSNYIYDFGKSSDPLPLANDAAYKVKGTTWRMPTANEWKELMDNCTWQRVLSKSGYGFIGTSKKTGYTNKTIYFRAGVDYWTSNKDNSHSGPYVVQFYNNGGHLEWAGGFNGTYVRAVKR